ncbi:MAG: PolC-type DNA polymerase III [Selenomonadaceae bacterium]|nr:PolC-type DNA polymerase III [Selenomonadaceae bacterium]
MRKYRIVPQKENMFWQLVQGMDLAGEERRLLKNAAITHVEVTPKTNRWEVLLQTQELIGEELLTRAAGHIRTKCALSEVLFYQQVADVEAAVAKNWAKLAKEVADGNQIVYFSLRRMKPIVEGSRLKLTVGGEFSGEILTNYGIPALLRKTVKKMLGFNCDVEIVRDFVTSPSDFGYDEELAERNIPVYAPPVSLKEYQQAVAAEKSAAPPPPTSQPSAPTPHSAPLPTLPGADGLLLGKIFGGEAVKIETITEEMKNVVIEGFIGDGAMCGVRTNEFKTGTKLLTFAVADDTNGIGCKKFFKDKEKEEFERVTGLLKPGMEVRLKGSVKFDTYQNEYMFFVDSIAQKKGQKREDKAAEKRTELHAHTTMSNMDGVVSVKNLIKTAARWGHKAIAITDHGVVQAFPDAAKAVHDGKLDIKIIYGMEGYLVGEDYEQKRANHIILLAKNPQGLQHLYQLVSLSHLKYLHRQPRIPKALLAEYREGLIIGSACEAGELIRAIVEGRSEEELLEIAAFYDYLEIQPIGNNEFLKRSDNFPDVQTDDDLRNINLKVAALAKKLGKMLIATGDVHFLNPEDAIYRAILMKGKGYEDAEMQAPLFLRTTEEMLQEFAYLGEEEAYAAVVTNPGQISDMVEVLKPIPDDLYSPMIPGADEEIREMSYHRAKELYGENLPKVVEDRLEQELKPIIGHGFSVLYLISQRLVKKSNDDGYLVGSRGSVGSSFIATMTGITEVNPLPPHWRCPHCQYSKFIEDGSYGCGYDLPDRECPVCGTALIKDGHDIPFAVFLGFDGDKVPDIDLNFSGEYQPQAHKYTEVLFGKDNVYRAGTIATVADKTAFGYVLKFYEEKGIKKHRAFIERMAQGCMGVKRTTGQHPAGIMVVPRNMDIHFFTPIQRPADDKTTTTITTHFDYQSISSRLVKLDILGHDDPTVIKMLEDLTHRDPKTIPFDDKATLSIFSSTEALGVTPEELGANSGTFGIPEFRTGFTRQMIDDTHPNCFSDLVRISGFSHGTDVWLGNAQELIRAGTCTLKDAISARDDIMMYLIHHGIDPLLSFKTMEGVRKGKGIKPEVVEILRQGNVPEWYIESCQKIKYLFPRAHATAYVMMAYRIAFCKVHYPLAFYAAYFSIRAAEFDANVVARGKDYVGEQIKLLEAKAKEKKLDVKDSGTLIVLQLAWEMYLRGFKVEYVDLYKSDAEKFIILEDSLLPPLASLAGMGNVASRNIVEARQAGYFTSVDDLHKRSGISKTCVEILREHGCLDGMSESDQMALFGG